jgi:hypothetical protein
MDCFVFLHIEVPHIQSLSVWAAGGILITPRNEDIIAHLSARSNVTSNQTLIFPKRNKILQPP